MKYPNIGDKTLKIGYWGDSWIRTTYDGSIWEMSDWDAGLTIPRDSTDEYKAQRMKELQDRYPGYKTGKK